MHESRNGTHSADVDSMRGVSACAAFCIGTLLGGRRPCTLTAILLEDLKLTAGVVSVNGQDLLVPFLELKFRQEKFDCNQGPREVTDHPHYSGIGSSYVQEMWMSAAFWVYRYLVLRGCFAVFDPLRQAKEDDVLDIKFQCMPVFVFCDVQPNYWVDTLPTSVGTIGNWNKHLLRKLGSQPRGFSAHRSGFVSRTCVMAILNHQGKELPLGTLEMITRWGGWQVVTGTKTVMQIYARKIVDHYMDPYSLINGSEASPAHRERMKLKYIGQDVFPKAQGVDYGRTQQHLQVLILAWRNSKWSHYQQGLNAVCKYKRWLVTCCLLPLCNCVSGDAKIT